MADPKKENGIRWTGSRKTELVLELVKGADVTEICRKNGISQAELFKWRDNFIQAGKEGLKLRRGRKDTKEKEISRLERKIGHMAVQMEILEEVARLKKRSSCRKQEVFGTRLFEKRCGYGDRSSPFDVVQTDG